MNALRILRFFKYGIGLGAYFYLPYAIAHSLLLLSLSCNQAETKEVVYALQDNQHSLALDENAFSLCNIKTKNRPSFEYQDKRYYSMIDFPEIGQDFDLAKLHINLSIPENAYDRRTCIEVETYPSKKIRPQQPGAYINYDLNLQKTDQLKTQYGGLFDFVLFNHKGVGNTDFILQHSEMGNRAIRLNSLWIHDQPEKMATHHWGDSIMDVNNWSYPIRFLGFKHATNFQSQPNFATIPQPAIHGISNVPSRVDIYLENEMISRQNVGAGAFDIGAIPVITRAGELVVKTHDLLGRETVLVVPYYSSNYLLKPGLKRFSYNLGVERVNYGLNSFDYGRFLIAGLYQQGITNSWTLGTHGELLRTQQTFGIDSQHIIAKWLEASFVFAGSHSNQNGVGGLTKIGLQRRTRSYAIGTTWTHNSSNFKQLGLARNASAPNKILQSYASYHNRKLGSINASYTLRDGRTEPALKLLLISYNRILFRNFYLSFTYSSQTSPESQKSAFLSLLWAPTPDYNLSNTLEHQDNEYKNRLSFSKNLPIDAGYGYRLAKGFGNDPYFQAESAFLSQHGLYQAKFSHNNQLNNYEVDASGSLLYFNRYFRQRRKIDGSFILIKGPQYKNVDVYNQHIIAGQLDKNGYFLIPYALPYQSNQIEIDPLDIPLNATLEIYQKEAFPYYRSGVFLEFPSMEYRNVSMTLKDNQNQFLPPGAIITLPNEKTFPVGYAGRTFISLDKDTTLLLGKVSWHDRTCQFSVDLTQHPNEEAAMDLGEVVCDISH